MPKNKELANIRVVPGGYQVTVTRNGERHEPFFSNSKHGGAAKALAAAQARAAQLREELAPSQRGLRLEPLRNKWTTGVAGVTRSTHYDWRRDLAYLRYGVLWYDDEGRARNKTFQVGRDDDVTADQELHAFRTAVYFRLLYVACREAGEPFYPEWFDGWKERRIYEDVQIMEEVPA